MKRTPQEAIDYLTNITFGISHKEFRNACFDVVINDDRFRECWGGTTHHHTYDGGLAVHTAEVVENMLIAGANYIGLTAAIFHDYAKIKDYVRDGAVMVNAPYKKLIFHIQGSAIAFNQYVGMEIGDTEAAQEVTHCILSHHGRREWGSPIDPQTKQAMMLHHADYMSMMFGEGK